MGHLRFLVEVKKNKIGKYLQVCLKYARKLCNEKEGKDDKTCFKIVFLGALS